MTLIGCEFKVKNLVRLGAVDVRMRESATATNASILMVTDLRWSFIKPNALEISRAVMVPWSVFGLSPMVRRKRPP